MKMLNLSVLCLLTWILYTSSAFAAPTPANPSAESTTPANYFPAIIQELARLQIVARCTEPSAVCTFEHRSAIDAPDAPDAPDTPAATDATAFEVQLRYSRVTDTVYIYIDRFLIFAPDESPTPELLLRLLSLNAEMVTSKLEWQASSRTVRLSTVVSCDSNFDRRAFRSQLTGLLKVADTLSKDPSLHPAKRHDAPTETDSSEK